jgi:hypothetical protein
VSFTKIEKHRFAGGEQQLELSEPVGDQRKCQTDQAGKLI